MLKDHRNSGRHAYIMMVHNEWRILRLILNILDDTRNDFFIHIDLKVDDSDIPFDLKTAVKRSNVFLVPRMSVTWGGDSQVECELKLMEAASKGKYRYYHFISGVDMPLKTPEQILSFFSEHDGENFFRLYNADDNDLDRIRYYYLFQNRIGNGSNKNTVIFQKIMGWGLKLQKLFQVDRIRNTGMDFYKGEIWFSITNELMQYIVSKGEKIRQVFKNGWCADELCWETIAMNSPYRNNVVNNCLRYIDWDQGSPYVFHKHDYDRIMHSDMIFARKFSDNTDSEVVDMIYKELMERKGDT